MSSADAASGGPTAVAQHAGYIDDASTEAREPSAQPVPVGGVNKDSLSIDIRAPSPNALLPHAFRKPSDAGLKISTPVTPTIEHPDNFFTTTTELKHRPAALVSRPSWKSQASWDSAATTPGSFPSPSWSMSSPALANLSDVTPLPSPLVFNQSPDFRKFASRHRSGSNISFASVAREEAAGLLLAHSRSISPQRKKKAYTGLGISGPPAIKDNITGRHARDRSLSEYIPEHLQNARLRNVTAPVAVAEILQRNQQNELGNPAESQMHRELFLSKSRGYAPESPEFSRHQHNLLTPPDSLHDEEDTSMTEEDDFETIQVQRTTYRILRKLGHGAFSDVVLASRKEDIFSRDLIAIKVVNHKLARGSDEERIGTSITREIEILQDISHPCLPKLIAFENDVHRALLAMQYCRGGDLFELASQERDILTPTFVQRIFAELVDAVSYLHSNYIVHRDIKLESEGHIQLKHFLHS
jgi:protein-serine/threonine kinase